MHIRTHITLSNILFTFASTSWSFSMLWLIFIRFNSMKSNSQILRSVTYMIELFVNKFYLFC